MNNTYNGFLDLLHLVDFLFSTPHHGVFVGNALNLSPTACNNAGNLNQYTRNLEKGFFSLVD